MLILQRKTKAIPWYAGSQSEILIGENIRVTILNILPDGVIEVGIDAPRELLILRGELAEQGPTAGPPARKYGPAGGVPSGPADRYREAARRGCRGDCGRHAGGCDGGGPGPDGRGAFGYPDGVGEGR